MLDKDKYVGAYAGLNNFDDFETLKKTIPNEQEVNF